MPSTYDLDLAARRLLDVLDETGGDLDAIADAVDAFVAESTDKLAALRAVAYRFADEEAHLRAEAAHFTARARSCAAVTDRCKASATTLLLDREALGEEPKVRGVVHLRRSVSVSVDGDPADLPAEYQRVKVDADKTAIKRALDAGESVPGCSLVETPGAVFARRKE